MVAYMHGEQSEVIELQITHRTYVEFFTIDGVDGFNLETNKMQLSQEVKIKFQRIWVILTL